VKRCEFINQFICLAIEKQPIGMKIYKVPLRSVILVINWSWTLPIAKTRMAALHYSILEQLMNVICR